MQMGVPQGPGFWQQSPPPPPLITPYQGGGYVPTRKNRNTVVQVKALLAQATPGQLLDMAKHASAELRSKNPGLHQELVKAVIGGAPTPKAQALGVDAKDPSEIIRRKAVWKEKCEADSLVTYRDSVIVEAQKQFGVKAAVDDLVCDMPGVRLKEYMQGKKRREVLLSECGLAREGANFVLLPDWVDTSCQDSLSGDRESDSGESSYVTRDDFIAMQVSLFAKIEELMGKPKAPPAPVVKPSDVSSVPASSNTHETKKDGSSHK